jgi:glycosyltransferase involved in cell wall biosynthesis
MPMAAIHISVVIPTCNRLVSLERCLNALASQTYQAHEVIIVDASSEPISAGILNRFWPALPFTMLPSEPSVCKQRNAGIREASGTHILLCDDDIVLPPDYIETLVRYVEAHPDTGAVTGSIREPRGNQFVDFATEQCSMGGLIWSYLFQLSVWGDIEASVRGTPLRPLFSPIVTFYRRRSNGFSYGGWPTITHPNPHAYSVALTGLGAALIKREWLLQSPYDEILDPHGIGDHYGVATGFPGVVPIAVVSTTHAIHHRSQENRLLQAATYYRRTLALHYFITSRPQFGAATQVVLLWSLLGNLLSHLLRLHFLHVRATLKAALLIVAGRNPYILARRAGLSGPITPAL